MEVSTPSDFLKPAYVPNRTEFSAADFRFLQKCRSKTEKYLRFPPHSAAVKALAAKTALHNPSTTLHNPSTIQAPGIAKQGSCDQPIPASPIERTRPS
jgi:hypothetical protein